MLETLRQWIGQATQHQCQIGVFIGKHCAAP
jgi:hypothetical protein